MGLPAMPLYLEDVDINTELEGAGSVLIVPCRMCPATSLSLRKNMPFFKFFKSLFRSPALDEYIENLRTGLRERGIDTGVYFSRQFLTCAWTSRERNRLRKQAEPYDTVIVLGCNSATESVRDALGSSGAKVIQGMQVSGIVNVKVRFHLPGTLLLEDHKIISMSHHKKQEGMSGRVEG